VTLPAEQKTEIKPFDEVRLQLKQMESQFKMVLPEHVPPEKFTRVVLTAIQKNSDLLLADRKSFFSACLSAATDGLLADNREGAMVVYNTKEGKIVSWQPMVSGILKKVRNSGELKSIAVGVVVDGEDFEYWVDEEGPHLRHTPNFSLEKRIFKNVYAVAKTKDSGVYMEVMTKSQVDQVRNSSKAKNSAAWTEWYEEMARKSVIRRLSKRLPMSTDLERVIYREDDLYDFEEKKESLPPPEYLPGFEPRMTTQQWVSNFKELKNSNELFTSMLEKLKGTEWESRLVQELERQGVGAPIHKPNIPNTDLLPFEKQK